MIDYVQGTNTSTLLESNVSSVDPNVSGELQLLSMVLSGGGQPTSFHVAERDSLSDGLLFAQECEQYRKRLFCKAMLITRNREDAEDAVQETLMHAYRKRESFEGRSAFGTWLMSILINVSLMHLRKKRVRQSVSLDEAWEEGSSWIDSLEDRRESSEAHLLKAEEYELFRAGLDCLQPELREVLLERLKETPVKEIACRRGISEAAAKSRLMRREEP